MEPSPEEPSHADQAKQLFYPLEHDRVHDDPPGRAGGEDLHEAVGGLVEVERADAARLAGVRPDEIFAAGVTDADVESRLRGEWGLFVEGHFVSPGPQVRREAGELAFGELWGQGTELVDSLLSWTPGWVKAGYLKCDQATATDFYLDLLAAIEVSSASKVGETMGATMKELAESPFICSMSRCWREMAS